jgi:cell division protein FtsN
MMNQLTQTERGSTTLGIIVGVVLGLAVALGVSLYLANSGAPLQPKSANAPARIEPPKDISKAADPNESLYTKPPKVDPNKKPDEAGVEGKLVPMENPAAVKPVPEQDAISKIAAMLTPAPAQPSAKQPIAMPKAASAAAGGERYFVQAGAFSNVAEAEALRARLAMQGVSMSVSPRDNAPNSLQRVRTEPLLAVDAEKLRNNLKANGIETSLVKVQ